MFRNTFTVKKIDIPYFHKYLDSPMVVKNLQPQSKEILHQHHTL